MIRINTVRLVAAAIESGLTVREICKAVSNA
jgi:hypothetical protein